MTTISIPGLEARFSNGADFISSLARSRLSLLEAAHREGNARVQLEDWEDLGKAEQSIKHEYSERYLFELIQNANDAIRDWCDLHPDHASDADRRVRVVLTPETLFVANTGEPFRESNVRSICRLGQTTKAASKHVGHKGVGFKSVLGVTYTPEIYSDRYAFGFSRAECEAAIRNVVGREWSVDFPLPIHRFPFPRNLSSLPSADQDIIAGLFDSGYATVVRLPLIQPWEQVAQQIRLDITPQVLLFLRWIRQIEIKCPLDEGIAYWRDTPPTRREAASSYQVTLSSHMNSQTKVESRWLILEPDQIEIKDRNLISQYGPSWQEVTHVGFSMAIPLNLDGTLQIREESQPFHVYFPTGEDSGFQFAINADFYVGASRKHIPNEPFNQWLSDELAFYLAERGVSELLRWFPDNPAVVDILAPIRDTHAQFDEFFRSRCLEWLKSAAIIPLGYRQYEIPEHVRLTPMGADAAQFRTFFGDWADAADWHFPMLAVEQSEVSRHNRGRPFLLGLGTRYLQVADVVDALKGGLPFPPSEAGSFFEFMSRWWQSVPIGERSDLIKRLQKCRILPTTHGWQALEAGRVFFQGIGSEEITVPEGFAFDLIVEAVYQGGGQNSLQFQLFRELGVIDYSSREIIRRAIVPTFELPERFANLARESILQAYQFLKKYWETRRGGDEIADNLVGAVRVPATRLTLPNQIEWRSAREVYFSLEWAGNDDLERVYGEFDDACFLATGGLIESPDQANKSRWGKFFEWLGVSGAPKLISSALNSPGSKDANELPLIVTGHAFSPQTHWQAYLEANRSAFFCRNPRHPNATYQLPVAHAIHRFDDIVRRGQEDPEILVCLFRLIGMHWEAIYRHKRLVELDCKYSTCPEPSHTIPNYFFFALKHADWVPSTTGLSGGAAYQAMRSSAVWTIGATEPATAQEMVPVLPLALRGKALEQFQSDIDIMNSSRAGFADYLELLQRLPDLHPLERDDLDEATRVLWHKSVRTLFNWLCERMSTALRNRSTSLPSRPATLKVVAFQGDRMSYADVKEVIYSDMPDLEFEWADACKYLRIDEDQKPLRDWMDVHDLSALVISRLQPTPDLPEQTEAAQQMYRRALPYLLTVAEQKQPSRYENLILPRLQRLRFHVVEDLAIHQTLMGQEPLEKYVPKEVHLEAADISLEGGGRAREGHLFIKESAMGNSDLFGEPIANFIEIRGLADAFITLFGRDDAGRLNLLKAKGIPETYLQHARQLLNRWGEVEAGLQQELEILKQAVQQAGENIATPGANSDIAVTEGTTPPVGSQHLSEDTTIILQPPEPPPPATFDFPEVNPGQVVVTQHAMGSGAAPNRPLLGSGNGGGGIGEPIDWQGKQAWQKALGLRGETIVRATEELRLQRMGVDPTKYLRWISKEHETADHDFESVDEGGRHIIIEVKTTGGSYGGAILLSPAEFRRAVNEGGQYWLYYVTHAASDSPRIDVYRDPIRRWLDNEIRLEFAQIRLALPTQASQAEGDSEPSVT